MFWIAIVIATASEPSQPVVLRECRRGEWFVQETPNFQVWSQLPEHDRQLLAESCEAWRRDFQAEWFGRQSAGCWEPKCQVVVHPTAEGYNRALGRLNDRSVGCTTLKLDEGRVVYRRIDLRADAADWQTSALPHELTHVVIAGYLGRGDLPPWADEGMAALAEPEAKQARRAAALEQSRASGHVYAVRDLLALNQPPRAEYRSAFYGQSVSLVRFLVEREGHEGFVEFLQASASRGQEPALRDVYGIHDAEELERLWQSPRERPEQTSLNHGRPDIALESQAITRAGGAGRRAAPAPE